MFEVHKVCGMSSPHRAALRLVPDPAPGATPRTLGAVEVLPGLVRAALMDMSGAVLRRGEAEFAPGDAAGDSAAVDAALRAAAAPCFVDGAPLGIGVAAAGLVDADAGLIIEVNDAPALRGYPVRERLARFGAPVHVEHRARLQVLGDRWFGPGRGRSDFASVSTGEVLGVGILLGGEVLAPPGGRSGAHMTVAGPDRVCTCGARGCWKTVATTRWLRERVAGTGLPATLAGLAASTDPDAAAVVDEYAGNLALGLLNIQQLFAPGLFVLHGEARDGGEGFRERVVQRLRAASSWSPAAEPPAVVVSSTVVDDIALLGGAGLVLSAR
ncbi:ROK family protein [Pseudonocardia zijingensis]|uniref:ROK family protein n=2 Tax=Pseudonocardia zijingensis TaxID=153376 RepID=A0ABN1PQV0_9PSEU